MPAAKPDRPAPMMIVSYMYQSTKSQASNHKQILSTKSQRRKQLPVTVSLHFIIGVLDLFDAWCLRFGALPGIRSPARHFLTMSFILGSRYATVLARLARCL